MLNNDSPLYITFTWLSEEGYKELVDQVVHLPSNTNVTLEWSNCSIKAKASVVRAWIENSTIAP